jgi:hypothetical protein
MRKLLSISLAMLALLLGACAGAPQKAAAPTMAFTDQERATIMKYYADQRARMPARDKPAAQYKAGDKLQSGMRPTKLPNELSDMLSGLASPYTRLVAGGDVILVNRDTHDIADVVPQVAY